MIFAATALTILQIMDSDDLNSSYGHERAS